MEFKRRSVRKPRDCGRVLDQDVLNIGAAGMPGDRISLDPFGSEAWSVFLPKCFSGHAVRVSFQRYGPIFEVRHDVWRNADVVINNVGFCRATLWIQDFAEARALECVSFDVEHSRVVLARLRWRRMTAWSAPGWHISIFAGNEHQLAPRPEQGNPSFYGAC